MYSQSERKWLSRQTDLKDQLEHSHSTNRSLQSYVSFLKQSYSNTFQPTEAGLPPTVASLGLGPLPPLPSLALSAPLSGFRTSAANGTSAGLGSLGRGTYGASTSGAFGGAGLSPTAFPTEFRLSGDSSVLPFEWELIAVTNILSRALLYYIVFFYL